MDYRELLRKYMAHVGICEGSVFLTDSYREDSSTNFEPVRFTDEEWAELNALSDKSEP